MLLPMGIAAALGALLGTVSQQFSFIVHLVAAAPIPLFFILSGIVATIVMYWFLGIFYRKKKKSQEDEPLFGQFDFGDPSDSDYNPSFGGTSTLIGPDGTSYPVHNVGYGYMVNGKLLRDFDPHGDSRPVDEDGVEYTRY